MRWQFIRFYIGTVAVLLIAGAIFFYVSQSEFEKRMDEGMERFMTPWVTNVREKLADAPADGESRSRIIEETEFRPKHYSRRDGHRGGPPPARLALMDETTLPDEARERLDNGEVVVIRNGEERTVYASVPGGEVMVIEPKPRDSYRGRRGSILVILAPPLAVLLLIGLTTYLLIRPIERRISSLVEVTRSFGAGSLDARVQVGRKGSIDELEESFNAMAGRIGKLINDQRELLRAVSHDLRTPLARVFFALDDAQAAGSAEEKNSHLERIDRSMVELNGLVEELLTYLRLEEAELERVKERIDIASTLQDAADLVAEMGGDTELEMSCEAPRVLAAPHYLKRAVINLVTNALAHARSRIWITCREEEGAFILSVHDDGEGVPEEEREKIFEPFYRRDPSRSAETGGSGLGLAIVSRIMAWHGGSVQVSESPHGGAMFTLRFPDAE
jgi:two-component system sensor histidine kinase RstB